MKKLICMVLALMLVFSGCAPAASVAEPTEPVTEPQATLEATETDPPEVTLHIEEKETETTMETSATGAQRIEYRQNASSVRYITRVADLPAYEALDGYRNEEYFETKALLVVVDTVTSGSVKVSIGSVGNGTVTLAKEMSGDVGTTDMATWLLWAEVDQGLTERWTVTNPGVQNNLSTY